MSATNHIANLLGLSLHETVIYCEQVRKLSGLGAGLHYKTIYNHLMKEKSPYSTSQALAIVFQKPELKKKLVRERNKKVSRSAALVNNLPGAGKKQNIYEHHEVEASELEEYTPKKLTHLPQTAEAYSYLDHERILTDKLTHCKHGVSAGYICAICNPVEFRRMTGID